MARRTSSGTKKKASHRRGTGRGTRARRGSSADGSGAFGRLECLAHNFWWTWNPDAQHLFESLDPALWKATHHNPIRTIRELDATRRASLEADASFHAALDAVEARQREYLGARTWYDRTATGKQKKMRVAYFCMEYGLHECVPLYAGGLGILAADHLKSASDLGIPLTGVGILWRYGYYKQEIGPEGDVRVLYPPTDFGSIPVTDTGRTVLVPIGRSEVVAKIWKLTVGRVELLLLDTGVSENKPADRKLTHHLYGGDNEYRIRQEVLLGVGGLLALEAMGVEPTVHHLNEGHAAFAPLERVRRLTAAGESYERACEKVASASVFTTHTPVPEGNDRFDVKLFNKYIGHYAADLGVSGEDLLALGREEPTDRRESFCMTVLALKLANHCNGVAELHGETARGMWTRVFDVERARDVPIGHVTNGVHPETWVAPEARPFYDRYLKPSWVGAGPEDDWWRRAGRAPAEELWNLRQTLRRRMITRLREHLREQAVSHFDDPSYLNDLYETLDEDALTIGFARRFALYKRAPLIFRDAKRLARIMGDPDRPVQLIFSGKAHPLDAKGHDYVKRVTQYTRKAPFRGRVVIVENYDTSIGRMLTQGCDVWLNNPVRPMEASGTSGMKPALNGGLNCSILDGWWPEGYDGRNGWAIGDGTVHRSRARQDREDAEAMYRAIEEGVVPTFYERDRRGIPRKWVKMMVRSFETIPAKFSSHRMLSDYTEGFYWPANG